LAARWAIHGHIDGWQDVARFIFFVTMRQGAVYAVADSGVTETHAAG
jgi:hypothetical protein